MAESVEQPRARVIEDDDDDDFQLPDGRIGWVVSLLILLLSGAAVVGMITVDAPRLWIAAFVLFASFIAPFVSGVRGYIFMDRVVPFAGMLGALAVVYFNVCLNLHLFTNKHYDFFTARRGLVWVWRDPEVALLYTLTFVGVPTASVIGGVVGCVIARKRRGAEDDHDLMM